MEAGRLPDGVSKAGPAIESAEVRRKARDLSLLCAKGDIVGVRMHLFGKDPARLDDFDANGNTPLHHTARQGHRALMAYLVICHDADLFVRNGADEMAVHTALQNGHLDIPVVAGICQSLRDPGDMHLRMPFNSAKQVSDGNRSTSNADTPTYARSGSTPEAIESVENTPEAALVAGMAAVEENCLRSESMPDASTQTANVWTQRSATSSIEMGTDAFIDLRLRCNDKLISSLRHSGLFVGCSDLQLSLAVRRLTPYPVDAGDVLVRKGDAPANLFIATDGTFEIQCPSAPGGILLFGAGVMGDTELALSLLRRKTIQVVSPGLVWRLTRGTVEALCSLGEFPLTEIRKEVRAKLGDDACAPDIPEESPLVKKWGLRGWLMRTLKRVKPQRGGIRTGPALTSRTEATGHNSTPGSLTAGPPAVEHTMTGDSAPIPEQALPLRTLTDSTSTTMGTTAAGVARGGFTGAPCRGDGEGYRCTADSSKSAACLLLDAPDIVYKRKSEHSAVGVSVTAGTPERLTMHLFEALSRNDQNYISSFLLSYRRFTTSSLVFEILHWGYITTVSEATTVNSGEVAGVRAAVLWLLATWTSFNKNKRPIDPKLFLESEVLAKIRRFAESMPSSPGQLALLQNITPPYRGWAETEAFRPSRVTSFDSTPAAITVHIMGAGAGDHIIQLQISMVGEDGRALRILSDLLPLVRDKLSKRGRGHREALTILGLLDDDLEFQVRGFGQVLSPSFELAGSALHHVAIGPAGFALWKWMDPEHIARLLTCLDGELFSKLQPQEFLGQAAIKDPSSAATLVALTRRFNQVCDWVVASVLGVDIREERARTIEMMIKVAQTCYSLRNFNGVSQIVTALKSAAVWRLKDTWKLLPSIVRKVFRALEKIIKPDNNRRHYRNLLKGIPKNRRKQEFALDIEEASTPCLPILGVFVGDIVSEEEGYPDKLTAVEARGGKQEASATGVWVTSDDLPPPLLDNFFKHRCIGRILREIHSYQSCAYNSATVLKSFGGANDLGFYENYFEGVKGLTEDHAWMRSQLLQRSKVARVTSYNTRSSFKEQPVDQSSIDDITSKRIEDTIPGHNLGILSAVRGLETDAIWDSGTDGESDITSVVDFGKSKMISGEDSPIFFRDSDVGAGSGNVTDLKNFIAFEEDSEIDHLFSGDSEAIMSGGDGFDGSSVIEGSMSLSGNPAGASAGGFVEKSGMAPQGVEAKLSMVISEA